MWYFSTCYDFVWDFCAQVSVTVFMKIYWCIIRPFSCDKMRPFCFIRRVFYSKKHRISIDVMERIWCFILFICFLLRDDYLGSKFTIFIPEYEISGHKLITCDISCHGEQIGWRRSAFYDIDETIREFAVCQHRYLTCYKCLSSSECETWLLCWWFWWRWDWFTVCRTR